jgi:hypothetical protein
MAEDPKPNFLPAQQGEPLVLNPKEERESQTARILALTLVAVLVLAFMVHYGLTAYLGIRHPETVQQLTQVFSIGFSVFSSLAGTAVGFYLKERK